VVKTVDGYWYGITGILDELHLTITCWGLLVGPTVTLSALDLSPAIPNQSVPHILFK
jgi:hypothetical protein